MAGQAISRINRARLSLLVIPMLIANFCLGAKASDLSPQGTKSERAVWQFGASWFDKRLSDLANRGLHTFKEPVHEEITHRAYNCAHLGTGICDLPDADYAPWQVIAGVRWNDDPPFQLSGDIPFLCKAVDRNGNRISIRFISQPECWGRLFLDAESKLRGDPRTKFDNLNQSAMPLRSHFGDLQFLHSMASADNEPADVTLTRIREWGEFTWDVVQEKHKSSSWLRDIKKPDLIPQIFGTSGWRIQDLFALGDPQLRQNIPDVAFGSLLHMIQDSFSASHVERMSTSPDQKCDGTSDAAPGPVRRYHAYAYQKGNLHAKADTRQAYLGRFESPNAIDVSKVLIRMRKEKVSWDVVNAYLTCVFAPAADISSADAGDGFR